MVEHYLNLMTKTIFIENMALSFFIGMCSFLACSRKVDSAIGLGIAVTLVTGLTTPLNNLIYQTLLVKGALAWVHPSMAEVNLEFLAFLIFIGSIAAATQLTEMTLEKYFPPLYSSLGIFLPLIAVNCAILAASLFMQQREYGFGDSLAFGFGVGISWSLAIVCMAAAREKMRYSNIPKGLRGLPISFLLTGLMALGFLAFSGIQL